jgi:hypothetical protein
VRALGCGLDSWIYEFWFWDLTQGARFKTQEFWISWEGSTKNICDGAFYYAVHGLFFCVKNGRVNY